MLRPEGNLIISGFNPRSLWGLHRALGRRQGYPWHGQFIALRRLKDWLALLGFEVAGGRFAAYAPPFQTSKWLERFSFMEAAGRSLVGGERRGVFFACDQARARDAADQAEVERGAGEQAAAGVAQIE